MYYKKEKRVLVFYFNELNWIQRSIFLTNWPFPSALLFYISQQFFKNILYLPLARNFLKILHVAACAYLFFACEGSCLFLPKTMFLEFFLTWSSLFIYYSTLVAPHFISYIWNMFKPVYVNSQFRLWSGTFEKISLPINVTVSELQISKTFIFRQKCRQVAKPC